MSCCHKDDLPKKPIENAAKALQVPLGVSKDLIWAGQLMERGMEVKMKVVDP